MLGAFKKLSLTRQKEILNAAASVFAEEGYHFARVSKVCEKAGISNGALYKYFRNKEDLFFAVLQNCLKLISTQLYAKYIVNTKSVFDAIDNFLTANVQFNERYNDYLKIYADLGSNSMQRLAASASEIENMACRYTVKLVADSKKRGELNDKLSDEVAAYIIDSHITFFVYSLVSEYHSRRFDSFYAAGKTLTVKDRIRITIDSLKQTLK